MRNVFAETYSLREEIARDRYVEATPVSHTVSDNDELEIHHIGDETPSWDPFTLFATRLSMG